MESKEKIKLLYRLEGSIAPKARPRFSRHAYLPESYRQWRNDAELQLLAQGIPPHPLGKSSIEIILAGKHSRRGDCDNIAGSILDALVAVGILKNDNLANIPELSIALHHSKESPIALIKISEKWPTTPKAPKTPKKRPKMTLFDRQLNLS